MNSSFAGLIPKDPLQLNLHDNLNDDGGTQSSPQQLRNASMISKNDSQLSPHYISRVADTNQITSTSTVLAAAFPQTRSAKRRNNFRAVANVVNTSKQRLKASWKNARAVTSSSTPTSSSALNSTNKFSHFDPKQQLKKWKQPTEMKRQRALNQKLTSQLLQRKEENRDLLQQLRMEKMDFSYQRNGLEQELLELETRLEDVRNHDPSNYYVPEVSSGGLGIQGQQVELEPVQTNATTPTTPSESDHLPFEDSREDPMKPMVDNESIAVEQELKERRDQAEEETVSGTALTAAPSLAPPLRSRPAPSTPDSKQAAAATKAKPITPKDPIINSTSRNSSMMMVSMVGIINPAATAMKPAPKPLRVRNALSRARLVASTSNSTSTESNSSSNNNNAPNLPPMQTSPKDPMTVSCFQPHLLKSSNTNGGLPCQ